MPARTLVELLHTAAAVVAALLVTRICAWAYPLGARTIWWVGIVAAAAVAGMSVPNLKTAWAADRARPAGEHGND